MSFNTKYQSARIGVIVGLVAAGFCIYKLSGSIYDASRAKFWFAALIVSVVLGITAGLLRHYYKSRAADIAVQQKIAVETLSRLGDQRKKQ